MAVAMIAFTVSFYRWYLAGEKGSAHRARTNAS
jgi:hypothetical protein